MPEKRRKYVSFMHLEEAQICFFYASLLQVSLHMHTSLLTCMELAAKIIADSKCSNSGLGTQLFLVYMSLLQVSFTGLFSYTLVSFDMFGNGGIDHCRLQVLTLRLWCAIHQISLFWREIFLTGLFSFIDDASNFSLLKRDLFYRPLRQIYLFHRSLLQVSPSNLSLLKDFFKGHFYMPLHQISLFYRSLL